jgi:hypothetical protein
MGCRGVDERGLPSGRTRFNAVAVPDAVARLAEALAADDAATRVEELARLGEFERLRDLGVPEDRRRRGSRRRPPRRAANPVRDRRGGCGALRSVW